MTKALSTNVESDRDVYPHFRDTISACEQIGSALQVAYGLPSPHHGTVMMLTCKSENITTTQYLKRYHADGSMRASAIQAEFLSRGGKIEWINIGDDGKTASAKFSHESLQPTPLEIKYTIEDARRQVGAKMDKEGSNWKTNPGAMLRAALIRKAIKIVNPGVIGGYDEFNEFDTQAPVAVSEPVVDSKQKIEERRAELLATQSSPAEEPIVDAVVEKPAKSNPKKETTKKAEPKKKDPEPEPEPEPEAKAEPEKNEPEPAKDEKASNEQLHKLLALGSKFPSQANVGMLMSKEEIAQGICSSCDVDRPNDITVGQADELIERWEELLSSSGKEY